MNKEYIAYQGPEFTIEWYYADSGKSSALKYFNTFSREKKLELDVLFKTIAVIWKNFKRYQI